MLYKQRVEEISPNIRYCAYNIGERANERGPFLQPLPGSALGCCQQLHVSLCPAGICAPPSFVKHRPKMRFSVWYKGEGGAAEEILQDS